MEIMNTTEQYLDFADRLTDKELEKLKHSDIFKLIAEKNTRWVKVDDILKELKCIDEFDFEFEEIRNIINELS